MIEDAACRVRGGFQLEDNAFAGLLSVLDLIIAERIAADRLVAGNGLPFVALFLLGMVALAVFPPLVTFLPSLL